MKAIFFEPDYQERVWGGRKLATVLKKAIPYEHTGESWEIACHANGQSIVRDGEFKGLSFRELLQREGDRIIGRSFHEGDQFPLLIKFIDAMEKLSVQVHPEDAYAKIHENGELGKSECWYIIEADPGAKLVAGLKEGVTKEIFEAKLKENCLEEVLHEVEVKAGDVLDIPAGLIHAIGDGILLAEVQQNSDTTYRVYDWGRVGLDGRPRDLHIRQSLEVSDFDQRHSKELVQGKKSFLGRNQITHFIKNSYFTLKELRLEEQLEVKGKEAKFEIFICVAGMGQIQYEDGESHDIVPGDSFLLPYEREDYRLLPSGGSLVLLKTFVEEE